MKGETVEQIVSNNICWLMHRIAPLSTNANVVESYVKYAFENFIKDMQIKTKEEKQYKTPKVVGDFIEDIKNLESVGILDIFVEHNKDKIKELMELLK